MDHKNQGRDSALWHAFLQGDNKAYAQIYQLHAKAMYAYGIHFTTNSELVEDAIHDVFVKMYSNRAKLAFVENIRLYLLIALKNTLFNSYLKNVDTFQLDQVESSLSSDMNVEEKMIENEHSDRQKRLLSKLEQILSPRQKQAIYYRFVEQMSYKEIALIMDINLQSVKNIVQTSIKKIRKAFPDIPASLILIGCALLYR